MIWLGYVLLVYLIFVIGLAPTPNGKTGWERMKNMLKNFTWIFWALFILMLACLSMGS